MNNNEKLPTMKRLMLVWVMVFGLGMSGWGQGLWIIQKMMCPLVKEFQRYIEKGIVNLYLYFYRRLRTEV